MKYAQYISKTQINTNIPRKARDPEGRMITGDLTNRPDILRSLGFFPLSETPVPQEPVEGRHYEKRYSPPENDEIIQTWVSVEDPPPPPEPTKVYSKLKILMAADEAGFAEDLMDMIEADRKTKYIWDASNTIEDNELLSEYIPAVAAAIGRTEAEVRAFLNEKCLAD